MKIKMLAAMFVLSLGATNAFAQKGVEDGSQYGHGEDSIACLSNLSIYTEYVKTENYVDAFGPWKAVFDECPRAQLRTYTNGLKIVKAFLTEHKNDEAKYNEYFDLLMKIYDQRIQYFPDYQNAPAATVLGMKAVDYMQLAKSPKLSVAYDWLAESVNTMKSNSEYYILQTFMGVSSQKFKADSTYREQFILDYLNSSSYAEEAIKQAEKETDKKRFQIVKDNLDAYFINSGAADCDMLQTIYADKVEENKENLEYLNGVVSLFKLLKCTEQEAYFAASLYAHQISPTASTAAGCGYMSLKKQNLKDAISFFEEAASLEEDNLKKAEYLYTLAAIFTSEKQYSRARQFALRALEQNPNYGQAYILIATMYAASPKWSDEPALNSATYYLVIDKLQRAKNVDPSVAEEANRLIGIYAAHTPKTEDLFFLNLKKGDTITIGGWIGESTVIR